MCGRLDQNHTPVEYVQAMHWPHLPPLFGSVAAPSRNASPGTLRPLLRVVDDGLRVEDLFWGYRAAWAEGKLPVAINARLEKLAGRYWSALLARGRAIVPADGWYEWTGEKGRRQPWHVHLKSRDPVFLAALANPAPARGHAAEGGFVLVTADAEGGLVDVHDRRPIALSAADAALWLDPALPAQQAEQLIRAMALPADQFDWHPADLSAERVARAPNQPAAPAEPNVAAQSELPLA